MDCDTALQHTTAAYHCNTPLQHTTICNILQIAADTSETANDVRASVCVSVWKSEHETKEEEGGGERGEIIC